MRAFFLPVVFGTVLFCINASATSFQEQIDALEQESGGRIGVSLIDTGSAQSLHHRAKERFPMGCTSKFIAVAALLDSSREKTGLLEKHIRYTQTDSNNRF